VVIARGERLLPVLQARLQAGEGSRALFDALACTGTLAAADVCAGLLEHPQLARLAADALRAITGIDPTPPVGAVAEQDDCPRDEVLLPLASPEFMREQWQRRREQLAPKQRYLHGRPVDPGQLRGLLNSAPMRRRHLLAAELAMRTAGAAQVATTTWTRIQRAQLDAITASESAATPAHR
jgi:hypothetical protein